MSVVILLIIWWVAGFAACASIWLAVSVALRQRDEED